MLSLKEELEVHEDLERAAAKRSERLLSASAASAELLRYNIERGMSRATAIRTWGRDLYELVMAQIEVDNSANQTQPPKMEK